MRMAARWPRPADSRRRRGCSAEALPIARAMKNEGLIAQIVTSQGDVLYYKGDFGRRAEGIPGCVAASVRAKLQQEEIADPAESREDRDEGRKVGLSGRNAEPNGRGPGAARTEIRVGGVLAAGGRGGAPRRSDTSRRGRSSTRAASRAEQLGARTLLAQAHQLLAVACAANGDQAEARRHATTARQALEAIRKDAREKDVRDDQILQRSDLKPILQDTVR